MICPVGNVESQRIMGNKGFASLSKAAKKTMGSKGGKAAQAKGNAFSYNSMSAKAAAMKSVQTRKMKAVRKAAIYLLECGVTAKILDQLGLTADEYIYFGGHHSTKTRIKELEDRINSLNCPPT
jgi:hypothetical protein